MRSDTKNIAAALRDLAVKTALPDEKPNSVVDTICNVAAERLEEQEALLRGITKEQEWGCRVYAVEIHRYEIYNPLYAQHLFQNRLGSIVKNADGWRFFPEPDPANGTFRPPPVNNPSAALQALLAWSES